MALSIDWSTGVISVPQADLTNLGGGIYELDVNAFRLELRSLEDDEQGIVWPVTHTHNTSVALSGVTYARVVEMLSPYTIDFENGTYTVKCINANHNIADVKVVDNVSLIISNSAGLVESSGGGASAADIADAVWDEAISGHTGTGSTGAALASASSGSVDYDLLAGAVWGAVVDDNQDAGSFGDLLAFMNILLLDKA